MEGFETRQVGRTPLRLTVLGLGTGTLGGHRIPVGGCKGGVVGRCSLFRHCALLWFRQGVPNCRRRLARVAPRRLGLVDKSRAAVAATNECRYSRRAAASDAVRGCLRLFLRRDHALVRGRLTAPWDRTDRHTLCP